MGVKLILSILIAASVLLAIGLLFAFNLSSDQTMLNEHGNPKIYIVKEPKPNVYIVGETSDWVEETKTQRYELNKIRAVREASDNQKEFELISKLSNVRRIVDGELIVGYDKDIDNTGWKEVK